jgi:hypothetical protein
MKPAYLRPLSALMLGACGKGKGGLGPDTDAETANLPGLADDVPAAGAAELHLR